MKSSSLYLIRFLNTGNIAFGEILELLELNKKVYSFGLFNFELAKSQTLEIFELIQTDEAARDSLTQLIDNNLELNYDFDSLMNYLKKKEKRSSLNI